MGKRIKKKEKKKQTKGQVMKDRMDNIVVGLIIYSNWCYWQTLRQ